MNRAAELGMASVAVTDVCNFYGLIKFQKAALGAGLKPIFGADLLVADSLEADDAYPVAFLVMNDVGYQNLTKLISRAYQEGQTIDGTWVLRDWIAEAQEGLLILSGAAAGDVGQALLSGKGECCEGTHRFLERSRGDRYYLEIQRTGRADDEDHLHAAVELAVATETPVVATTTCVFSKLTNSKRTRRVCASRSIGCWTILVGSGVQRPTIPALCRGMAELFSDILKR